MTEHFQLKTPTKLLNYNILKKSRILYPTEVAKFYYFAHPSVASTTIFPTLLNCTSLPVSDWISMGHLLRLGSEYKIKDVFEKVPGWQMAKTYGKGTE